MPRAGWEPNDAFRAIYRARGRAEAKTRLVRFLGALERDAIRLSLPFAAGMAGWREELLTYFEEPMTNGDAEGVANRGTGVKRRAVGLPSFASFFRRRVFPACG